MPTEQESFLGVVGTPPSLWHLLLILGVVVLLLPRKRRIDGWNIQAITTTTPLYKESAPQDCFLVPSGSASSLHSLDPIPFFVGRELEVWWGTTIPMLKACSQKRQKFYGKAHRHPIHLLFGQTALMASAKAVPSGSLLHPVQRADKGGQNLGVDLNVILINP